MAAGALSSAVKKSFLSFHPSKMTFFSFRVSNTEYPRALKMTSSSARFESLADSIVVVSSVFLTI